MDVTKIIAGVAVVGLTIGGGLIFLSGQPSVSASVAPAARIAQPPKPAAPKPTLDKVFASQCSKILKEAIRTQPRYYKGSRATSTPAEVCDCAVKSMAALGVNSRADMEMLIWMDANQVGPVSQQHVIAFGKTDAEIVAERSKVATELSGRAKKLGHVRFIKLGGAIEKTRRACQDKLRGL